MADEDEERRLRNFAFGELNPIRPSTTRAPSLTYQTTPQRALREAVRTTYTPNAFQGLVQFQGIVLRAEPVDRAYDPGEPSGFVNLLQRLAGSVNAEQSLRRRYKIRIPELHPWSPQSLSGTGPLGDGTRNSSDMIIDSFPTFIDAEPTAAHALGDIVWVTFQNIEAQEGGIIIGKVAEQQSALLTTTAGPPSARGAFEDCVRIGAAGSNNQATGTSGGTAHAVLTPVSGSVIIPPVKRSGPARGGMSSYNDHPQYITTLPSHGSCPLRTWTTASNFMQRRGRTRACRDGETPNAPRGRCWKVPQYQRNHGGIDINGPWGTEVYAVADATVVRSSRSYQNSTDRRSSPRGFVKQESVNGEAYSWYPGFSNYGHIVVLKLKHAAPSNEDAQRLLQTAGHEAPPSQERWVFYCHLSDIEPGITVGAEVSAGALIGKTGTTNGGAGSTETRSKHFDSSNPHLHLELLCGPPSGTSGGFGIRNKVRVGAWNITLDPTPLLYASAHPSVTPAPLGGAGRAPWRPSDSCGGNARATETPETPPSTDT